MRLPYIAFALVAALLATAAGAQNELRSFLRPGQSLVAKYNQALVAGDTRFVMQEDCNLVVYHGGKAAWATDTNRQGRDCVAIMQGDGNLVLLRSDGKVLWASGTHRHPGAWVVAQTDGNLVIYPPGPAVSGRALWATNTDIRHRNASRAAGTGRFAGCAFARTNMKCMGVVELCQAVWSCGFDPGSARPIERSEDWGRAAHASASRFDTIAPFDDAQSPGTPGPASRTVCPAAGRTLQDTTVATEDA